MFGNIGWGEMLVLVIAGLVILGPERLSGAIRWTAGSLKQVREYLSSATGQLRQDLGPEFEDLRQPLSELQKLRGMTPRAALTKHLLDGDDSFITGAFDAATPDQTKPLTTPEVNGVPPTPGATAQPPQPPQPGPTQFDPDAT